MIAGRFASINSASTFSAACCPSGILQGFGVPGFFAAKPAASDVQAAAGHLSDDSTTRSGLIGCPTTPMAQTVRAALAGLSALGGGPNQGCPAASALASPRVTR